MIIFFDFDDTLFDREKFISALTKELGISQEEFLKDYNRHFKDRGRPYSLKKHLEFLGGSRRERGLDHFFRDLSAFVYPESYQLLQESRRQADKLILLSYGDEEMQSKKIRGSGLTEYFDKIIVTSDKAESLKEWYSEKERIIFINDKSEENERIKNLFPGLEIIKI
ncbi:MAG TPA: HAD family hydrolase [Patescibacteria group bacterium]|nr:HAD family hydrolase [Patescibacteria group bacterium]